MIRRLALIALALLPAGCGPHRIEYPGHTGAFIEEMHDGKLVAVFKSLEVGTPVEVVASPAEQPEHVRVRPLSGDHQGEVVWMRKEHVR